MATYNIQIMCRAVYRQHIHTHSHDGQDFKEGLLHMSASVVVQSGCPTALQLGSAHCMLSGFSAPPTS
jgi:copper(I)-binding protein